MSFSVASYFTCSLRASSASATSVFSPIEGAPPSCHAASPFSTPLHRKTNRKRQPLLQRTRCGAVPSAATHDGRRTIYSRATPTPFSTAPGHGHMKSLAHIPHCRRASERLAEVCLCYTQTSSSSPRPASLRPSIRLCAGATTCSSTGPDDSRELLHPHSLHSICISPASAAPAASF